ncbi:hypothetical protein [Proteus mirabilis]|uniref:hypothetical protein n=1 Tax=Proteus mirabilis TaxID=584 RepID=UPI0034D6AF85
MLTECSILPDDSLPRFFRENMQSTYRTFLKEINVCGNQILDLIYINNPFKIKKSMLRVFHIDNKSSMPFFVVTFSDINSNNFDGDRSCGIISLKTYDKVTNENTLICEVDCLDGSLTVKIDNGGYYSTLDLSRELGLEVDRIVQKICLMERAFIDIYLRQVNLKVHHGFVEEIYEEFR